MKKSAFGSTVSTLALRSLAGRRRPVGTDDGRGGRPARRNRARRRRNSSSRRAPISNRRARRCRSRPPGTAVSLTLDEATARALERNLELAVERLNPQTFDLNIARLEAAYRPTLTSQFGQRAARPAADQPAERRQHRPGRHDHLQRRHRAGAALGRRRRRAAVQQQQAGHVEHLRELQPDVQLELQRGVDAAAAARLPASTTRGSSCASRRINRDISEIQLRGTIATTLARVRNAYWELVYAHRGARGGARVARRSPSGWSPTTARASKSARWRRSTSCRRKPRSRPGVRRSRRPKPRGARRSSRSSA